MEHRCRITSSRVFASLAAVCLLAPRLDAQQDTLWYGHRAFADGRYDDAIAAYQAAIQQGSSWDWLPELVQTVEARKLLGSIAPPDTHRIGAIFVSRLNAVSDTGTVSSVDATAAQRETWHVYFGVFSRTLESFSAGQWTAVFDTVSSVSTYRTDAPLAPDNPDHLDLGTYFFDKMPAYDSFITFSNTRSPARGLARQYPYLNGVLYGPHRGMAAINAGSHGYGVLLHEFFHIVEWVSNAIGVTHGYLESNRSNFPGWTGTTEFDYYRWHFANTLPGVGWGRLQHRSRWVPYRPDRSALDSVFAAYASIPLRDRQTADTLVDQGVALFSGDTSGAVARWEQARALSPYHPRASTLLHNYYRFDAPDSARAAGLLSRLRRIRRIADFVTLDTVNVRLGEVVGRWQGEDLRSSRTALSWDITGSVTQSGTYTASFYYTSGADAALIDSVTLLEDGTVISTDAHQGSSGTVKTDISYALAVPAHKPAARYTVEAKMRATRRADSFGQVHLLRGQPPTSAGGPEPVPRTMQLHPNFPNPFNPSTTVRFETADRSRVRLTVVDLLGREVATLADGEYPAGVHEATWSPPLAASGVYLVRLMTTEGMKVRKVILMR